MNNIDNIYVLSQGKSKNYLNTFEITGKSIEYYKAGTTASKQEKQDKEPVSK